jgi:predicted NodU family carbamoyl transferase
VAGHHGEEVISHGHGHGLVEGDNKKIAILISVLALFLAVCETLGKSAQTDALKYKAEASNLWAFFQAKTIRKTTMETAAEQMEVDVKLAKDPTVKDLLEKRASAWKTRAARYESEPETQEGRKELSARAKALEAKSDLALAKYHNYEFGSAAFQIAIVLASSYLITQVVYLLWGAIGVGGVGLLFTALGLFAPNAMHLFGAH